MKEFPKGFLWGAATSAFQVEGGLENMDWAKAASEGKVPRIGRACDHYHLYEKDFDLAKSLGHNCHRLSIEWSRIEPEEGKFDEKEINHYREVLKALHARNLVPFVTLWHFTLPLWFSETGGFERKDSPEIFARYAAFVTLRLSDLCNNFSTINEALPFTSNGWRRGTWPPFKKWPLIDFFAGRPSYSNAKEIIVQGKWKNVFAYFNVLKSLSQSHNAAYDAMKKVNPNIDVGIVTHILLFHANANPINKLFAWIMNWHFNHHFMGHVYKKCDSIGLNYYLHKKFGDTRTYEKTDMGWDVYPEGISDALLMLKRYKLPIYVSEAGVADATDKMRASYIRTLVEHVHIAIQKNVDVRGFMYWSLLDNYELAEGYTKRFGLIEINYETLERTVRPSAFEYKKICDANALEM